MTQGFKDPRGKFHPIRRTSPIKQLGDKKNLKEIKTVTLSQKNIKKIMQRQAKKIRKGQSASFSSELDDVISRSR